MCGNDSWHRNSSSVVPTRKLQLLNVCMLSVKMFHCSQATSGNQRRMINYKQTRMSWRGQGISHKIQKGFKFFSVGWQQHSDNPKWSLQQWEQNQTAVSSEPQKKTFQLCPVQQLGKNVCLCFFSCIDKLCNAALFDVTRDMIIFLAKHLYLQAFCRRL